MRLYIASAFSFWFLFISQGSATTIDMCSSTTYEFSSDSETLNLQIKDIDTIPRNCSCEITTESDISVCLAYSCSQCRNGQDCNSVSCLCTNVNLSISPTCNTKSNFQICSPLSNKAHSCHTSTMLVLSLSTKPSIHCGAGQDTKDLVIGIQPIDGQQEHAFKKVKCISVTSDASRMVIGIGVGVGVGGGVLLIIAIIIVIFIIRRRRAESNKLHANNALQATVAAPSETGYTSYNIPVSAAYDNATNGTTLNYESIAYDNEEAGNSNHAYTEVKEISDHNGYDNREMGRSEAYSMCKETGKDYDYVSENPTANIENETTVIDNEFYG